MNEDRSAQIDAFACIHDFVVAGASGEVTDRQWSDVERLLCESDDACRLYAKYVTASVLLPSILASMPDDEPAQRDACELSPAPPIGSSLLGDAWHGTLGFFAQEMPRAYLIATVIFGLGALIGSLLTVSHHVQIAGTPAPSPAVEQQLPPEQRTQAVARVTGLVDCRWERKGLGIRDWGLDKGSGAANPPSTIHHPKSPVRLGDRISLASGLLQLTYDTGAKVILQGPCTYEVDSPAGGFLSLGKLTARVESGEWRVESAKPQAANQKSEIRNQKSNPQSLIPNPSLSTPHSPLFTVTTPTAVVTDLGTEFGVEVDEAGVTGTHVFAGMVRLVGRGPAEDVPERTLLAGQAVRLDPAAAATGIVDVASRAASFVRKMPVPEAAVEQELIARLDYSDTWTANSVTRAGSYLLLTEPEAMQVERSHGNPPRRWVFSSLSAMTTMPFDQVPMSVPWPGHKAKSTKLGFFENGAGTECYLGFEYGLRDDFVVQFDAVQTADRINVTIGDQPATIEAEGSLSVFIRAAGTEYPEIGVYTPALKEFDTDLRSGIEKPHQWHNYAVRFDLLRKKLSVWVDREYRGSIDLAKINHGMESGENWASLAWTAQYITIGGNHASDDARLWLDNCRIGAPSETVFQTNNRQPQEQKAMK